MDAQEPRDAGARRGRRDTPRHRGLTALRLVTLAACLAFALMLATAPPREAPRVGAIGAGCSYELDTWTGTLTIRPTDGVSGEMARVYGALPGDLRHAVRSVSVERGVLAPADSSYLFCDLDAVEALDLSGLDTSRVTDMSGMFWVCSSLTSLDLSGWDTSRVTDMGSMFYSCKALRSLDLSPFDTSRVTDMEGMFSGCKALRSLDLSHFDTSRVTSMGGTYTGGMFSGCSSLVSLDLSGWDTSRVTDMEDMFKKCSSLVSLDLSGWDTSQVTNMDDMFCNCSSLASLDLSHFDTSQVTRMGNVCVSGIFSGCSSLASLDLSGWDTSRVEGMWGMFFGCSSLSSLAVGEGCGGVLSADRHTALPAGVGGRGWHSERGKRWLTLSELSSSRQGVADTYMAPEAWRSLVSPQVVQMSP